MAGTSYKPLIAALKKCKLWKGSILQVTEKHGFLDWDWIKKEGEKQIRKLDLDDCTKDEREFSSVFLDFFHNPEKYEA